MENAKKINVKKILEIAGNVLIWAFVLFSVLVTVLVFTAQGSEDGVPALFGKSMVTVQTTSMEPVYKKGDLVFLTKLSNEEKAQLKVDDIITFKVDLNGDGILELNTHRVAEVFEGVPEVKTKSNNGIVDDYTISYGDIVGICSEDGKISGLGGVIDFLRSSLGFFLCIVLPLILFFLYELYNFISLIVTERAKNAPVSKETEEEIKRRAIEEYLKQQENASNGDVDNNPQN